MSSRLFSDTVLKRAWDRMSVKQPSRAQFLETYKAIWPLVLPLEPTDIIRLHEGDWAIVAEAVQQLADSSMLGKALFGKCCAQVLAEKVAKTIEESIN